MARWLNNADGLQAQEYIANSALSLYNFAFDSNSLTRRYVVKSYFFYAALLLTPMIYLTVSYPFFGPTVFYGFFSGSPASFIVWFSLIFAAGYAFYFVALAQTYYFLNLLANSKTKSRFAIIAYSDFVTTSAIAVTGSAIISIIFALYTIGQEQEIIIEFDFTKYNARGETYTGGGSNVLREIRASGVPVAQVSPALQFAPSVAAETGHRWDYRYTERLVRSSLVMGEVADGELTIPDRRGGAPIQVIEDLGGSKWTEVGEWNRYTPINLESDQASKDLDTYCNSFALNSGSAHPVQVEVVISKEDQERLTSACLEFQAVSIPMVAAIPLQQIEKSKLFDYAIGESVRSLFYIGSSFSPQFRVYDPQISIYGDSYIFSHRHDRRSGLHEAARSDFEAAVLVGLGIETGKFHRIIKPNLPISAIIFASLMTSSFAVVAMLISFVHISMLRVLEFAKAKASFVKFTERPFTTLSLILLGYSILFYTMVRIIISIFNFLF